MLFIVALECFVLTNETSSDVRQIRVTHKCGGHDRRKNNENVQSFGCPQSCIDLGVKSRNTIDYICDWYTSAIEACKIQHFWRIGIKLFLSNVLDS